MRLLTLRDQSRRDRKTFRAQHACVNDEQSRSQRQDLIQIARISNNRSPRCRCGFEAVVNSCGGSDVESARRILDDEESRPIVQFASEDELLLVPAGERAHRLALYADRRRGCRSLEIERVRRGRGAARHGIKPRRVDAQREALARFSATENSSASESRWRSSGHKSNRRRQVNRARRNIEPKPTMPAEARTDLRLRLPRYRVSHQRERRTWLREQLRFPSLR